MHYWKFKLMGAEWLQTWEINFPFFFPLSPFSPLSPTSLFETVSHSPG